MAITDDEIQRGAAAAADVPEGPWGLLIDGEEHAAERTRTVIDPATGEPIAEVADASAADAERAVAAARAAYRRGDWSRITPGERAAVLDRWPTCWRSARTSSPARSRATRASR